MNYSLLSNIAQRRADWDKLPLGRQGIGDFDGDMLDITSDGAIRFDKGVPAEFSAPATTSVRYPISNGNLNKIRTRSRVLNEHAESSRVLQSTVTATNKVCQFFRSSKTNVNGLYLTLESGGAVVFDNFNSYANDAALQAVWATTGGSYDAVLETTIIPDSSGSSMKLDGRSTNNEWTTTFTAVNFEHVVGALKLYQTQAQSKMNLTISLTD